MMKNWKPAKKPAMKILGAWQAGQGNMPWQGRFYLPWQVFGRQVADPSRDVSNCKVGSATEVWDWDTFSCHCFCVVDE